MIVGSLPPCRTLALRIIAGIRGSLFGEKSTVGGLGSKSRRSYALQDVSKGGKPFSGVRRSPNDSKNTNTSREWITVKQGKPNHGNGSDGSILPLHVSAERAVGSGIAKSMDCADYREEDDRAYILG